MELAALLGSLVISLLNVAMYDAKTIIMYDSMLTYLMVKFGHRVNRPLNISLLAPVNVFSVQLYKQHT